jgi:hypothetical protein
MTKDELEQEIDDLQDEVESRERTLSRAKVKIKKLTEQLKRSSVALRSWKEKYVSKLRNTKLCL